MIKHVISGFYVHDFLEVKRMNEFNSCYNELIENEGFLPRYFPTVGLLKDLEKEKSHINMKPEVYTIHNTDYFLKPTSEAIAYPLTYGNAALKTPFKWYSVGPAFRNESKYCRKYERHKEIAFFHESHGIYSTENLALLDIKKLLPLISTFLLEQGIPHRIHLRPPQDTFLGAEKTYAYDTVTPEGKVLQILTVHYLGTNFSKAYKIGHDFYGICFGHSQRIIGALKNLYKDDLRWVKNPYKIISYKKLVEYSKEKKQNIKKSMYMMLREYFACAIEKTPGTYFCPDNLKTMDGDLLSLEDLNEKLIHKEKMVKEKILNLFESELKYKISNKYGTCLKPF